MEFFLTQFGIAFITIYLRASQTHNVIKGSYLGATITGGLMSIANVAFIGLIAHDPWNSIIPATLGGVLGVNLSINHNIKKDNK